MSVHVTNQIIKKEWTDYNEHLNMVYYVLIFSKSGCFLVVSPDPVTAQDTNTLLFIFYFNIVYKS